MTRRSLYVRIAQDDQETPDDARCGKLKQAMYGTRDAGQSWQYEYRHALESVRVSTVDKLTMDTLRCRARCEDSGARRRLRVSVRDTTGKTAHWKIEGGRQIIDNMEQGCEMDIEHCIGQRHRHKLSQGLCIETIMKVTSPITGKSKT